MRFLKSESYRGGIVLSIIFNTLSRVLSFASNVAIAYCFGTQQEADVYFFAVATMLLFAVFATGLDAVIIIPEAMRLREQDSEEASRRFLNFFIYIYSAVGFFVFMFLEWRASIVFNLVSNFDARTLEANQVILNTSLLLFPLLLLSSLLTNILVAYRYFTLPTLAGILNNLLVLSAVLLLGLQHGIIVALWAQIAAYSIQIISLIYLAKRFLKWRFSFGWITIPKHNLRNILYAQAGNLMSFASSFIPLFLVSGLQSGIVTSLNYGQKTSDIPNQLITSQFSSVSGIKFNELHAKGDRIRLNELFSASVHALLFLLMPVSAMFFICAYDIMTILFKRGAFDDASVMMASEFLRFFGLLLPLVAVNTLVSRLFIASQQIKQGFWYQAIFNAVLILIVYACVHVYGALGYPIGLTILHTINLFMCHLLARQYFSYIVYQESLRYFGKVFLLNAVVAVCVWSVTAGVMEKASSLARLLVAITTYGVLLMTGNKVFKVEHDISAFIGYQLKKLRRL